MKVLLDTHVWIWMVIGDERLSAPARRLLDDPTTEIHLSAVSVWELLVLTRKGRLTVDREPADWARFWCRELGVTLLPMDIDVAIRSERLGDYPAPDPGDRFIIGTALVHDLPLVTVDRRIRGWGGVRTLG